MKPSIQVVFMLCIAIGLVLAFVGNMYSQTAPIMTDTWEVTLSTTEPLENRSLAILVPIGLGMAVFGAAGTVYIMGCAGEHV